MAPQRSRAANHEKEKPIVIVCNILLKKQESSDLGSSAVWLETGEALNYI